MKKLLGIILIVGAFSQTTLAQTTKKATTEKVKAIEVSAEKSIAVDVAVEAKKNTVLLGQTVTLTAQDEENFFRLFEYKFKLINQNLAQDKKTELANIIEMKIRASLNSEQMAKLDAKPEVLKTLKN